MMQAIRDRAQGWIARLLVLFICIPFALWGIQEYLGTDPNVPVAEIDGDELERRQFQQAYHQQQTRLQNLFGAGFDLRMLDEKELKRNTLNELINDEVLLREGINNGLRIGDQQLAKVIQSQPGFQEQGRFSDILYQQRLRMSGYTASGFEHRYRRALLTDQIRVAVAESALVGKQDVENTVRLRDQKRIISLLTIPKARYAGNEITEEAIGDYYDAHQSQFVTPERISVDYLELTLDDLPNIPAPPEETLHALYESQKADYVEPEQRRARHILIQLDPTANEMAVAMAQERLVKIKQRLEKGDTFESLAKEYSEDTGTASQGGDLGFFGTGVMDPQFEAAAYSLAKGEVSEPVRSQFGFHLIELTDIRPSIVHPFEDIRDKLLQDFQQQRKEQQFFEQAEQLANLTFENPDTLAVAADALGLPIKETGFFDRTGAKSADHAPRDNATNPATPDGITKNRKFINTAFSEDVLTDGNNSEPIELEEYRVVILHRRDHLPPEPKPIKTVWDEISALLDSEKAGEQAAQLGKQLLEELRGGSDMVSISKVHNLTLREKIGIKRADTNESREIVDNAFRMPQSPDGAGLAYDSFIDAKGDIIIIALQDVIEKNLEDDDPSSLRKTTRDTLANTYGDEEYRAYIRTLRAKAKIRLFEENL
uniref:Periplasmic chaperone PpiD n=1 Tax=Candidatus Kentrum sp. MB TaxID=2138164 RepID=A0A450X6J3_9GAMM|nr:MAG: peptidyl-prolyl cis-trans isomerase D [Candidatus Kentron sp. MB]